MIRSTHLLLIPLLAAVMLCTASAKETTDPAEAKADADFAIQGEYTGKAIIDGEETKVGAQVIASGKGQFRVVVYENGLPGDGWTREDERLFLEGTAEKLEGPDAVGAIKKNGKMVLEALDGSSRAELKRIERKSKTLGAKAPKDAIVLFDGTNVDLFDDDHTTITEDKSLLSGTTTKPIFEAGYKLHLEFRLSWMPEARGQGRSNSGIYIYDAYECQVLDSFGLEGKNNECGGFYSIREPDVNMCYPPLTWQTYDIDFTAPKFEGDKKVKNARITILHNGVVIHDDVELPNGTPGRKPEGPGPRGIHIQGHGNKVFYRNLWAVKK